MSKTVRKIVKFEIVRQLKKPSFWISALIMPMVIGASVLVSYLAVPKEEPEAKLDEDTTVAILDEAGVLPEENPFNLYTDREEAIEAVKKGELDLFFHVPADFAETKKAEFYHLSEELGLFDFDSYALKGILSQYNSQKLTPLEIIAVTGDFEVNENKLTADGESDDVLKRAVTSGIFTCIFVIFMITVGSQLLMTVVEEKENRISEMILTATSSKHLIIGKIISMITLGLMQVLIFVVPIIIILIVSKENAFINDMLSLVDLSPASLAINLVIFCSSVVLFTGLCTMVGVMVPTAKDASQFLGPVIIATTFPLYFFSAFIVSEPSVLVQILTYFPPSAPLAILLRTAFGTLSTLEFCIGIGIVIISAIIATKLTVVIFQKTAISYEVFKPKLFKKRS